MTTTTEQTPESLSEQLRRLCTKRWVQVVAVLVAVFLILSLLTYSKFNGIRHEGVDRETALTVQYLDNQNELGAFISTFYEQLGIADRKSAQLDLILSDAVKGRYDKTGLTPSGPGQAQGNQLISAIVEAYPDLSGLSSYDRILDTIAAGRTAYKNKQSALLDKLRSYDKWREESIIGSVLIRIAGFPSDNLRAQVGRTFVTGKAAEDQMYIIVLPSDAAEAYTTGTLEPFTIPPLGEGG